MGEKRSERRRSLASLLSSKRWAALAFLSALGLFAASASASPGIGCHGATSATYPSESTKSLTLVVPSGAQAGDVLIASLGFGNSSAAVQPAVSAPAGWTLVSRTNRDPVGTLAVYWHVLAVG